MREWAEPRAHFLLAGDSADRVALRDAIGRLPVDAYGQVFVEVASEIQVESWDAPAGVAIAWLPRDAAAARGALSARGALLERAVLAWVAEWMPENPKAHALPYVMWIGGAANERIDRLCEKLAWRFDRVHLHDPGAQA